MAEIKLPETVEGFIDWTRRPFRLEESDGPSVDVQVAPGLRAGGLWTITTRFPGEILTADKYNADRQAMVDNAMPQMIDDYSASVAQMQATTNPFPGGSPSLAQNLAGEIERIRYVLKSFNPAGQWYELPTLGFKPPGGFKLSNNEPMLGQRTNGSYGNLLMMGGDDNIYVGYDQPATKQIVLGSAGAQVSLLGPVYAASSLTVNGQLSLKKGSWLNWDAINAIAVGLDNFIYIGGNAANNIFMSKYVTCQAGANIAGLNVTGGGLNVAGPVTISGSMSITGTVTMAGGSTFAVTGALALTKGNWVTWGDVNGITVDGSNNQVYIGGAGATYIQLQKSTAVYGSLYVQSDTNVGGSISAAGSIIAGAGGNGLIDGITAVRAWCRWVGGFAGQIGFSQGYAVGPFGSQHYAYRFVLQRPYVNGYAVAVTIEVSAGGINNAIARVVPENAQQFLVVISNTETNPIGSDFHLIVMGSL